MPTTVLPGAGADQVLNWNPSSPEKVRYTFVVSNSDTGAGAYASVTPSASFPSGYTNCTWTAAPASIAAGGTATYIAECEVPRPVYLSTSSTTSTTPAVTATFSGTWNGSSSVQASGTTNTLLQENIYTSASVTQGASVGTPDLGVTGSLGLGDQAKFTTTVSNSGTTTLSSFALSSTLFGTRSDLSTTCAPASIAPGASGTCTTTFLAASGDVASSPLTNPGTTVEATPSYKGDTFAEATLGTSAATSLTTEPFTFTVSAPVLTMVTDVAPAGLSAGDTVYWSSTASKTGTVSIFDISLKDQANRVYGTGLYALGSGPTSTGSLRTANYTFTAADAASSPYAETVTATGIASRGGAVSASATGNSTVVVYNSSYAVSNRTATISTDANSNGEVDLGDKVTYSLTVQNTGNVAWSAFSVTDARGLTYTCSPAGTTLAVGASKTCSTVFTPSASDLSGSTLSWTPKVLYTPASGTPQDVDLPATTLPVVPPTKNLKITYLSPASGGSYSAGTSVTWTYRVENLGNIQARNVKVTTSDGLTATCALTTLAPGASTTCTATKPLS